MDGWMANLSAVTTSCTYLFRKVNYIKEMSDIFIKPCSSFHSLSFVMTKKQKKTEFYKKRLRNSCGCKSDGGKKEKKYGDGINSFLCLDCSTRYTGKRKREKKKKNHIPHNFKDFA